MDARRVTKETARAVLARAAYLEFLERLQYLRDKRADTFLNTGSAWERFEETLSGIEEWLSAVYDRGESVADADFEFTSGSERCAGIGYTSPSKVIERELGMLAW
jgi:hypothetical protein